MNEAKPLPSLVQLKQGKRLYPLEETGSLEEGQKRNRKHRKKVDYFRGSIQGRIDYMNRNLQLMGNGCWEWKIKGIRRYGSLWYDGRSIQAHRFAWALEKGEIPSGFVVCHKCDNPYCCNPDHLFLGTQPDNIMDMVLKGRNRAKRGEDHVSSKLKNADVMKIKTLLPIMKDGQISNMFSVSRLMINRIRHGKTWGHI